jgi:hypothetical protein
MWNWESVFNAEAFSLVQSLLNYKCASNTRAAVRNTNTVLFLWLQSGKFHSKHQTAEISHATWFLLPHLLSCSAYHDISER